MKSIIIFLSLPILYLCTSHYLNAQSFQESFDIANNFFKKKDFKQAVSYYQQTIAQNPRCHQAYFNCAVAMIKQNNFTQAIVYLHHALQLHPDYVKAHLELAHAYESIHDTDKAKTHYEKAINLDNQCTDGYLGLARIYNGNSDFAQAASYFRHAMNTQPHNAHILLEYANCLNMNNNVEEALTLYNTLAAMQPHNNAILYNIAYSLKKLGRIDDAMQIYHRILERDPLYIEAHFGKGLAHLVSGQFQQGWQEYEWRHKRTQQKSFLQEKKLWDGSSLEDKTILLLAEQGLGDTLQFIRYAQLLKEQGATVIFASQSPLTTLLTLCPYLDHVINLRDPIPHFDVYAPLLSLPYIMNTTESTIPQNIPYIYVDPALEICWKNKLSPDTNFKIGICWQGNPNYSTQFLRTTVAAKSIPVTLFEPLMCIAGISIYSLQQVSGTEQIEALSPDCRLITFDDDFDASHGRFMDTAAVIKNLDLVISVDTSIAHLAGALGVPTWILIPEPPDWRWMLHRSDSPWYPQTMRLFRQQKIGDWTSVIDTIIAELSNMIQPQKQQQQSAAITAEISAGELIDKITILRIKNNNIKDENKLQNIRAELASLTETRNAYLPDTEQLISLTEVLLTINSTLWNVEDNIREKEFSKNFDQEFIDLARKVYITNDLRAEVKREINNLCNSRLVEEKSYAHYQ